MGVSLADQYYLKALDNYNYNIAEVIENLNYALSYNRDHADANCLMGRVYSEQIYNPDLAAGYFEQALSNDLTNIEAIRCYIRLLIRQNEYDKAKKMVDYGYTIKGINKAMLMHFEALLAEHQKNYDEAKKILKSALNEAFSVSETEFLKSEITRVKEKIKRTKMKENSDKGKKKKTRNKKKSSKKGNTSKSWMMKVSGSISSLFKRKK
jgi:tetratricopeptide (TPR) repeat protein